MYVLSLKAMRLVLLLTSGLLVSCEGVPTLSDAQRANTSEEVANVFVAAYPPVPWKEIADRLEPKHNFSTADARGIAAVSTQSQLHQFLSTFAVGLGLGLPSRTSSSVTTVANDGTSTTTSTRNVAAGTAPANSGATPVALSEASLVPDLSKGPAAGGLDAASQLMAGTGVFQLAQILDNQISKALPLKDYQAHLVTFQVNLQPKRRNLPYDAYINLTLMPASWEKAKLSSDSVAKRADELSSIIVYPLIIVDAMESSTAGKSIEVMRQAALSLSGVVSNVGVNAGVGGSSDRLDAILGADRNSLVTVGRISDHTLRIRIGAQYQGSRPLALVPRTQNLSVVVFTRAGDKPEEHLDKLAVITETTFVDIDSGKPVVSERNFAARPNLKRKVVDTIGNYEFALASKCSGEDYPLDLLRALDRGDYKSVSDCLRPNSYSSKDGGNQESWQPTVPEEVRFRRLVASLMTLQADSRYSKLMIPLAAYQEKTFVPPDQAQLVLLNDDKSTVKAVLRGGMNLDKDRIKPRLRFTQNSQPVLLLPTAIEVDPSRTTVTVAFPSIVGNKLMSTKKSTDGKKDELIPPHPMQLELSYSDDDVPKRFDKSLRYAVRFLQPEPNPDPNPVTVTAGTLVRDNAGMAQLKLIVGKWDEKTQGKLAVRVTGADIRTIEPAVAIDTARKVVPLTGSSVVTLTLGNLSPSQVVQLRTVGEKGPIEPPVTLMVEQSRSVSK